MPTADVLLTNGMIYDGRGGEGYLGDLAISGDRIAALGPAGSLGVSATRVLDLNGLALAPGFINMLSWAVESLIYDGRSLSDIKQGVTLEVMGEGTSFGPLSPAMKADWRRGILGNEDLRYQVEWTTLGEYLEYLERRGVSTNVASFVGSSTLRVYAVGYDDREPTGDELALMGDLAREAMREGAVGLSTALIYPPASYASTAEIIALARAVAEYDGLYISHIRSEGESLLEAFDEFLTILRESGARGEIYHLKVAGYRHWDKLETLISRIEAARAAGAPVSADMYTYNASGTGLNSCLPPWAHDGGSEALLARLQDPATRARIKAEMNAPATDWENMWYERQSDDALLLAGFQNPSLKPLTGKTLGEVARERGSAPDDTLIDLLIEDGGRIFTIYFSMSEDNVRRQMTLPWVSFCSDAESLASEGPFLLSRPHPRAYGSFARVLGKYCRDEGLLTLPEAVRRLSALPAANLKLAERGALIPGYYADLAIFDPATVGDRATFADPHQYAVGMAHVFVNGIQVLADGEHTGAKPGRVVRGPGWRG
jgi:N-acyl-D-amino-acid deacylase